jgi:hypothetical protein
MEWVYWSFSLTAILSWLCVYIYIKLLLIFILLLSYYFLFFRFYFFFFFYMVLFLFNDVIYVFLLLWLCILIVCLCMATLTEVLPCFVLSCKANARVKPAKKWHGPHSLWIVYSSLFYILQRPQSVNSIRSSKVMLLREMTGGCLFIVTRNGNFLCVDRRRRFYCYKKCWIGL